MSPLCLHFFANVPGKWIHSGDKLETSIHSRMRLLQWSESDAMSGKPFQSCLIPCGEETAALRSQRPPISYARITALLREKYGLTVRRAAIGKFVKVRSRSRKAYFFRREATAKKANARETPQPRIAAANSSPKPRRGGTLMMTTVHPIPSKRALARGKIGPSSDDQLHPQRHDHKGEEEDE